MITIAIKGGKCFTLVETLVASLLFTIIVAATYTSYRVGMDAYRECEARMKQNQEADIVYKSLKKDFESAIIDPQNDSIYFRARNVSEDGELWTCQLFSAGERFDLGDNICGTPCIVEYSLRGSDTNKSRKSLYRKVMCTINDKLIAESEPILVSGNIKDFSVIFLSSGKKTVDAWDSNKELPRAIKVKVKLISEENTEKLNSYLFVNLTGGERER